MTVDELWGLRQEVEVIVFVHQVLRRVPLALEVPGGPVTVDQLPVTVDEDGIPAVVDRPAGDGVTRAILHTFGPAAQGQAVKASITGRNIKQ